MRAAADGRRTAAHLAARGHAAVLAPVLTIVATGACLRPETTGGLIFTSVQAPRVLTTHADRAALLDLPCWCVGPQTAAAARTAGFKRIHVGEGDAASLARAILATGADTRWTLAAGRDRKPTLERALSSAGLALTVVEVYAAEAATPWTSAIVTDLATASAALHFSARSASLAVDFAATAGLADRFRAWSHVCLSDDVASVLRDAGVMDVRPASHPDEPSLLALLGSRAVV